MLLVEKSWGEWSPNYYLLVDESSLCCETVAPAELVVPPVVAIVDRLHVDLQRRRRNLRLDDAEEVDDLKENVVFCQIKVWFLNTRHENLATILKIWKRYFSFTSSGFIKFRLRCKTYSFILIAAKKTFVI